MSVTRVSDHVFSVGVMNPGLRVFDIVMEAKYGTTYNAYLIADQKTVLVETVHTEFFDEYLYNIQSLVDLQSIDYIIMNHTEPDHSGSLVKLLAINPNITVVCTAAAQKYLKAITNTDFTCMVVKHGDTLDIGSTQLQFVVAPLLHWPDSMMTYHPEDKALFSCDYLGCHYCEPTMMDSSIHYMDKYLEQFKYYYDCIFGPFKPYVLAGLDKIQDLEISLVCPSHGPVLEAHIKERIEDYRAWSTAPEKNHKTALVLYASAYQCTELLAKCACDAINSQTDVKAECIDMVFTPLAEMAAKVNEADALLVGSCTINRDAPKIVWDVLASIDAINVKAKPAGVFGSYGWSGEAVGMIKDRLSALKYKVLGDGVKVNFMPTEQDFTQMGEYAVEVVRSVK